MARPRPTLHGWCASTARTTAGCGSLPSQKRQLRDPSLCLQEQDRPARHRPSCACSPDTPLSPWTSPPKPNKLRRSRAPSSARELNISNKRRTRSARLGLNGFGLRARAILLESERYFLVAARLSMPCHEVMSTGVLVSRTDGP